MIIGKMGVAGNRRPIFRRLHAGNNSVTARKANYSVWSSWRQRAI
jgi:hypothetical protein